jgi:hypothetical protein
MQSSASRRRKAFSHWRRNPRQLCDDVLPEEGWRACVHTGSATTWKPPVQLFVGASGSPAWVRPVNSVSKRTVEYIRCMLEPNILEPILGQTMFSSCLLERQNRADDPIQSCWNTCSWSFNLVDGLKSMTGQLHADSRYGMRLFRKVEALANSPRGWLLVDHAWLIHRRHVMTGAG